MTVLLNPPRERQLIPSNRGSSEAISVAIIFLMVITLATVISTTGVDLLQETEDRESIDQSIIGFENVDDVSRSFADLGSQNTFATSSKIVTIHSLNARVSKPLPTVITIRGSETYVIESKPLQVTHDRYTTTYDTGIIETTTFEGVDSIRTPLTGRSDEMAILPLVTTVYDDDIQFGSGRDQSVLLSESQSPELVDIGAAESVTILTEQTAGWSEYIESHPHLTVASTDPDTGDSRVQINVEVTGGEPVTVFYHEIQVTSTDR